MRRLWLWAFGFLSSAAGACGIAGRAIMDTIGLANLPEDAVSAVRTFQAAVLWLASTGPVGAYVFNGALLFMGALILGYERAFALRAKHAEKFSERAAFALAIQSAADREVPLVKEMGDLVRDKIVNCYDKALDFLELMDVEVERVGSLFGVEPKEIWQVISPLVVRPFLLGTNIRSLSSPAFPMHGTLYLFQYQIYMEMERYNDNMAIIMRYATMKRFDVDFNGKTYKRWLEADATMRQAFVGLCVSGSSAK